MSTEVLVVGSLNYDILIKQDRLPKLGETCYGNELITMPGGKGANQAVQCAKLGLSVQMLGCVGEDFFGEELIKSLHENNIDTRYIQRHGVTGVGVVHILSSGDYYSTIIKGANYTLKTSDVTDHFFEDKPLVILQSEVPADVVEYTIERAHQLKCKVLVNNAPARYIRDEILSQIDYLVVNETEASYMTGTKVDTVEAAFAAAKILQAKVISTVFVTLGEKGSVMYDGKRQEFFEAVKCNNVVDATGAGDSWIGAIAWGMIKGYDIDYSINFASKVSAHTVQKYGGQNSFPTLSDIH